MAGDHPFTLEVKGNEKPCFVGDSVTRVMAPADGRRDHTATTLRLSEHRISRFRHSAIAGVAACAENAAVIATEGLAVRRASTGDAEAICAIYNTAIAERGSTFETEPRSAEEFENRADDDRFPLLVGDVGGGVIGWAGLASYSRRPCYAGIGECSVYVAAEARGRGIGTALTLALAAAAEKGGFHKLIGKLFADNAASIRLVERCDFLSVGLHRRHGRLDGAWRDVLVVERLLSPAA